MLCMIKPIRQIKKVVVIFAFLLLTITSVNAQKSNTDTLKDRDWRIEVEPSSFLLSGYGVMISHNVTKDNRLNLGLYASSVKVPEWAKKGMFNNVPKDVNVKLGFELAAVARYKFKIGKKQSNPYVGIIAGWEYFDIAKTGTTDLRISTLFATPHIGYEIYIFKQMVYINPQIRGVFYFNPKSSLSGRAEKLKPIFVLPIISAGIRL